MRTLYLFLGLTIPAFAVPVAAYQDPSQDVPGFGYGPNFAFVTDGTTVMNVGEMHVHITNWGLIGSAPGYGATYSEAPSCQWPAGSGNEYLFAAGLWVGGVMLGERVVTTGGLFSEWMPRDELEATVYEAVDGEIVRPTGNPRAGGARKPMPGPDDDGDGRIDEETLNGHDDDDDGRIDEDFAQLGNQMMVSTTYDNTRLARERFPDHTPMSLELIQQTVAWENDIADDFVGFDYTITNVGVMEIDRVYIGFYADSDVGPRDVPGYHTDDMAGSWRGMVRGSDGGWVPVEVGYMWDAAEVGAIDGYFGVVFLHHDMDPTGRRAPTRVGLRTFQSFGRIASFEQGGDPQNDEQAYHLLSAPEDEWDSNTRPGDQYDLRFLVSAGPFRSLPPDESLTFQVAMVCGQGLGSEQGGRGLLANCAEAWLTYQGIFVDDIEQVLNEDDEFINPGRRGRETMLCEQDFDTLDPFENFFPDYMDTSCLDPLWLLDKPRIEDADRFSYDGKDCAMFNMDNCFECARQVGRPCTELDFETGAWTCGDTLATDLAGCTGVDGLETQITWLAGMAPPPPGLRLWPTDNRVHVFWDDRSEHAPDIRLNKVDFESYRIWRADNWTRPFGSSLDNGPESHRWQLIAEYDQVNEWVIERVVDFRTELDTLPLGANTGMTEIEYRPRVLDDPAYAGLAEAMQDIVDADTGGALRSRPQLRDSDGRELPEYLALLPWETEPDVLDTFFAVAERPAAAGVVPKRATSYYEYVDLAIHNGFLYFYSVSATDHILLAGDDPSVRLPRGRGLSGDPGSAFAHGTPGTEAQTAEERAGQGANIYVYPNPATREALAEYQQFDPSGSDPTGVRVTFTNLPMAHNKVSIYTVAGDLVQTLDHDGTGGAGHVHWNLMSRNAQEVVSGVYLYSVQSGDKRFEDFVGKFVVVR